MKKTLWILTTALMVMFFALPVTVSAAEKGNHGPSLTKGTITFEGKTINVKSPGTYDVTVPCDTEQDETFTVGVSLTFGKNSAGDSFTFTTEDKKEIKSWPYAAQQIVSLKDKNAVFTVYAVNQSTKEEYQLQVIVKVKSVHNYGDWIVVKEATCSEKGEKERVCQTCGDTQKEIIDALGHDYGEWIVAKEAVNGNDGEALRTCQRDGCESVETRVIDAEKTQDNDGNNDDKETETGTDAENKIESRPDGGEEDTKSEAAAPASDANEAEEGSVTAVETVGHEHTYGPWVVVKEATCTTNGREERTCMMEGCIAKESRIIAAYGEHEWEDDYSVITEPTCMKTGVRAIRCKHCSEVKDQKIIPALGHQWDEGRVFKFPTETEAGVREYFCERCGHRGTSVIPIGSTSGVQQQRVSATTPHTGDDSVQMAICAALMGLALAGIGITAALRKKNA